MPSTHQPRKQVRLLHRFLMLLLAASGIGFYHSASAAAVSDYTGQWQTIDDETGKPKSIVEIYSEGDKLAGKVTALLLKPNTTLCSKCTGSLKDKPVVGMVILKGLKATDEGYEGGEILDPANGKTYKCKLWLENGVLHLRGYIGPFFRTQEWHRLAKQ